MSRWGRILCTLQLIACAVLGASAGEKGRRQAGPATAGALGSETSTGDVGGGGGFRRSQPRDLRLGLQNLLDGKGELRLFFPGCLGLAAPFLLFRLKREGYSQSRARASAEGLYLQARR